MTRTGHFMTVVLFLTGFLFAVYGMKAMGMSLPASPSYEGFAMSGGAIAGTVIGVLGGVGLLYYLYKRFRGGSAAVATTNYSGYNRGTNNGRGYNNRGAAAY